MVFRDIASYIVFSRAPINKKLLLRDSILCLIKSHINYFGVFLRHGTIWETNSRLIVSFNGGWGIGVEDISYLPALREKLNLHWYCRMWQLLWLPWPSSWPSWELLLSRGYGYWKDGHDCWIYSFVIENYFYLFSHVVILLYARRVCERTRTRKEKTSVRQHMTDESAWEPKAETSAGIRKEEKYSQNSIRIRERHLDLEIMNVAHNF